MAALDNSGDWEDVSTPSPQNEAAPPAAAPAAADNQNWVDAAPAAAPQAAAAPAGGEWEDVPQWRGYLPVAGSALARGAITGTGTAIAGAPELAADYNRRILANLDRIDRGEKVPMADDPIGYQDMDPELRKHTRADVERAAAAYKPEETTLHKAGTGIKEFAEKTFPLSPEEQQSVTAQAAETVGGMAPFVLAGAVAGPEAAIGLGMTQMGLSAAHEHAEAARAKGATPEEAAKAARMGFYSGAAAGALPLHVVMRPVERMAPGIADWARARMQHAAQSGVVFATVGEAQTWLGQQIAQNFYDPEAGYSLDVKRVLGSLLGGAFLGSLTSTPYRAGAKPVAQPRPEEFQDILGGPAGPGGALEKQDLRPHIGDLERGTAATFDDESILNGARPTAVPHLEDYVDQSLHNLRQTSRTAAGTLDVTSTPGKEEKIAEGLTPQAAAVQATSNVENVIRSLYEQKDNIPTTGQTMGELVNSVAAGVNQGIVRPGKLARTSDTKFPMQTAAADLPVAYKQFSDELAERLSNPNSDPIETAAWIEWRANLIDHFWSDGAGKASRALAALPLMRDGLPLPMEPPTKDFVAFAKEQPRVDPSDGGEAYLGPAWDKFNAFYHDMVYPRESLQAALDRQATAEELGKHPMVLNAIAENRRRVPTGTPEDFQNQQWREQRVYNFDGETVRGWDAAVSRLTEQARSFAGGQVEHGRHAVIVLGPPASGKSMIAEPVARKYRAAIVDADEAKKVIREYHNGLGTSAVHEESTELAKDIFKNIAREGGNLVLPKVGHNLEGIRAYIKVLKQLGYTVDIAHVAATPEISARRNIARFLQTGRIVEPDYIAEVGDKPRSTAYMLRGEANDFLDADTSQNRYEIVEGAGPLADIFRAGQNEPRLPDEGSAGALGGAGSEQGLIGSPAPRIPPHRVTAADGTAVDVVPVVVEASSLKTSQDPGYDTKLQPRQRDRAASQAQVRDIATNLDPERLGYSAEADRGAPIVGPDGMVESGNGRVLALRSVYQQNDYTAQAYRDWLTNQGIDVSVYRNPVLVRQRTTPMSQQQRQAFTVAANQAATLSMSATERAMADARLLDARSIGLLTHADDLGSAANRNFVRRFVSMLPQGEQGMMADARGALSADGLARVRNAVLARAYGDDGILSRVAESTNDEIRSISNALMSVAPDWARLRSEIEGGRVRADIDVTPELLEAVKRTADIRSRGDKLDAYLAQQDAFDRMPAVVEGFMRMFYDPKGQRPASTKRISDALRFYADEARKVSADEGLGLGLVPVKPRDIMRLAAEKEFESYGAEPGISDRGRLGDGARGEEGGREARGPWLGEGREVAAQRGDVGREGATVRAQRPDRPFGIKALTTVPGTEPIELAGGKTGEQYVFPGTEKISAAELLRRRAAEPMRPTKPQAPMAEGLFGFEGQQLDIEAAAKAAAAKPVDTGTITPQIRGTEQADAGRPGPESPGIRAGAPPVSPGKPAGRARRPTPAGRPEQLSLFGGGPGERSVFDANDAAPKQPGGGEPAVPGPSDVVTKPPEGSGRTRPTRTDTPAVAGLREAQTKIAQRSRSNYRITDEDQIGVGGPKQKVRANLDAIKILKLIEDEARDATPGEKAALVKYVGWGAFAQDMFSPHKREWKEERDTLRSLVSEEEYDAAKGSTLNAHYTSPDVIRGMWDALNHLGYDGGMALEPAAGVGHFLGLIPDKVAPKTAWTAVELDPLTGRIAKALYGGAEVNVHGFEDLKRPSNHYDLAISNVPFGNYNISEKPYGAFPIHDFFFVKSLDKVRPGGVVAFITSRYSMDRMDAGTRRLLAKTSDLIGAIRLPGGSKGAFAGNAGTEVTTDIMFLRKRIPGEAPFPATPWMELKEIQTPEGAAKINEYFADHPEMMLGEMRLQGTMYRDNEPVLIGDGGPLQDKILAAAQNMPKGAFVARTEKATEPPIHGNDIAAGIKDDAFFLQDGKLYQRRQGQGFEHALGAEDHDRVTRLVGMRDLVNDLLALQLGNTEGRSAAEAGTALARTKLQEAYDAFVDRHGPINKEERTVTSRLNKAGEPVVITRYPNIAKFMADPDAWKVSAIENYEPETGTATRATIQTRDVINPPLERQINGPSDALAAALDHTGVVDLDHIAQSLDLKTQEEVVATLGDLIYQNPDGRKWEATDQYLSGNVVKKLEDARAIAAEDTSYMRNVSALEKVQPTPLTASDITAQFGAPWVPPDVYVDFLTEIGGSDVKVAQVPVTGEWRSGASMYSRDARAKYGTGRVSVEKVVDAALNNRQLTVYDDDGKGNKSVNQAASTEARVKAELLKEAFTGDQETGIDGWAFADPDRAQRLEAIFNRTYNNLVQRKFDGSHLTLPGLNPDFATRQHRKDAVWRIIQNGNTLLAHVVGSGKTATMIAGGMEQKRLGLISKPAYVIPNHMLEQFSREFIQAYPDAKILVAQKDETTRENRKAFLAKVASNDWDGVIITHDAFGRINMGGDFRRNFIREQLDELSRVMRAEAETAGKNSPTVKGLEKAKKRLQGKLDALMNEERKDVGTSFEESGIDFLFVDEAHKFKNLAFITRLQRVKGLAQGDSQRAEDLFLKLRYLEQNRPGRSAVFATGTPVSNTMAELWTMQRYLQLDKLKERGLDTFDAWASTFGRVVSNTELSPDGRTFKDVSSFSKFVNVPELVSLYAEVSDTKTADMLNLPRPEVRTRSGAPGIEIVEAEPSSQEEAHIQKLVELAESLKGKRPEKGQPNMLSVVTEGRKVATDGRLISGDFDFNPRGKIALGVNNIARIYKEGNADPSAPNKVQMVFLDMGVPQTRSSAKSKNAEATWNALGSGERAEWARKAGSTKDISNTDVGREWSELSTEEKSKLRKYTPATPVRPDGGDPAAVSARIDLYADIKKRLVEAGIPANEIAAIHDAADDAKKAKLFQKVRQGKIRVLLGSTEKMGVGTNVQDRLIAMHHFDAPWKPAEVEQRDGRIVRQGNKNKEVQIYRYVTKRSFDAFMWQKLDTKSKFIGQVLSGAKGSRHAEDIDNPLPEAAEMKAAASGDPRIIEHAELDRQVRSLSAQRRSFEATKSRATWEVGTARERIKQYETALPNAREDAASVADLAGEKFSADLGGTVYTDRKEAGQAILTRLLAADPRTFSSPKIVNMGKLSGFNMNMELRGRWDGEGAILVATPSLKGKSGYGGVNDTVINPQTDAGGLIRRFENILNGVKQNPGRLENELAHERDNVESLEKTLAQTWPKEKDYRTAIGKLTDLTKALKGPKHPDVFTEEVKAQRLAGENAPEKVISAAVRTNGRVFSGVMHADAVDQAEREIGKILRPPEEGFITSNGRFISRDEAWDIANRNNQIDSRMVGENDTKLHADGLMGWEEKDVERNFAALAKATKSGRQEKEYLNVDGKPAWAVVVDNTDHTVLGTVRYKKAQDSDFHHNFYLPENLARKVSDGEATVAWADERGIESMEPMPAKMRVALDKYYDPIVKAQIARRGGWEQAEGRDLGPRPGETAVRLGRATEAHIKPSERYTEAEQKIADAVRDIGARMAPQADVRGASALRQHNAQIWGAFVNSEEFPHLIAWSLEQRNAGLIAGTVRHEIIHHLRTAGLFKPDEWSALRDAAVKNNWLSKYSIHDRYPDASLDHQIEEAVAERFSEWRKERSIEKPGLIRDAFQRLDLLLRRVAAAARSFLGRDATANDVFTRIETGEVGRRPSEQIEEQKRYFDEREAAQTPGEENRKRRDLERAAATTEPTIRQEIVQASDMLRQKAADFSKKIGADQIVRDLQMKIAPMAARDATIQSRAIAKEFMNARRQSRQVWNQADKFIMDNFPTDRRKAMWDAADEQSVAMQQGRPTVGIGLDRLTPVERRVVEMLQERGVRNLRDAVNLKMVDTDGLPSYAPRMVVRMSEGKYEHGAGPGAEVVRDIRTLALANAKLENAIAARQLINAIEDIGKKSGNPTVNHGGAPTRKIGPEGMVSRVLDQIGRGVSTTTSQLKHRKYLTREETEAAASKVPVADKNAPEWFTLSHPAFQKFEPRLVVNEETGKVQAVRDQNGDIVFDRKPIYIRSDFEGPLRAVLSRDTDRIYRGLMALKGKAMSVIMMSPLIHNQVEWGRALPAAPGKVVTFQIYFEGNKVANDPKLMERAISGGVVPIGGHGFMQDIVSIAEQPTVRPGRSLTAKGLGYGAEALGYLTRIYNPRSGADEVRRGVDWFGNLWHNTFLWDRVRDLQMGLWGHLEQHLIDKGHDSYAANVAAAHFANRYAGALPLEAMSGIARGIANILLFSRSFTLGNLGAYKDAMLGLPRDAQAMIERNVGWKELQKIQSYVKRKSMAMLAIDAGLYYATLSALQSAFNVAGVGHTVGTLGGMIAGGALGGRAGPYGRLAAATGLGAAGFGLAHVLGASQGTRDLEDELGRYWTRFSDLLGRLHEHPVETLGNPFKMIESLGATAENEPGKKSRLLVGFQPDGTAIYARLAVGKVTEELMGYMTEPNEMIHRKLSTFARPLNEIWSNDVGFGHKLYNAKADTPAEVGKNILKIGAAIIGSQIPMDTIKGAADWYRGGPGSEVSGMKAIAPFIGTTISKGFPGGPELGVLYDAKARQQYRVQEALPGIRDQIRQGDVEAAVAKMEEIGIPRGLQKFYIQTTQNPAARLTKRQMQDFMRYASPEELREFEKTQSNRPAENPEAHAGGGRILSRANGGKTIKKLLAESAIEDSATRLPEEIPPDALIAGKGIAPSRKHGDAMDYNNIDVMRSLMAGPADQNIANGGVVLARAHGGRINPDNINHNPTEAQKKANNYAHDKVHMLGLRISIENAKGSYRGGLDKDGKPWKVKMPHHYGYVLGTEARDGDHVDCHIGPHPKSPRVFVIDQVHHDTKKYDEPKCMIGFASEQQALRGYKAGFSDGKGHDRIGRVHAVTVQEFKDWLEHGNTKTPFQHAEVPETEKRTHAAVHYVAVSQKAGQNCAKCAHFIAPSACQGVKSPISPRGYCVRFKRMNG